MHESSIFKVWRGLVLYIFVVFWGVVSGWLWECFFNDFGMDCWSLEVTFSVILVSLGCLWTRLVPGGVQGADLVEIVRSSGALLAPFWSHFWSKTVMCLRCFFRCFCWIDLFMDVEWF